MTLHFEHRDAENAEISWDQRYPELNRTSGAIVDAAIEVHRVLGPGFLEAMYEEALCFELRRREVPFVRQPAVEVAYKGHRIGEGRLDLLVGGLVVVELKAIEKLLPVHHAQLLSYLKATGHELGLLLNFNVTRLTDGGIKRIIHSRGRPGGTAQP